MQSPKSIFQIEFVKEGHDPFIDFLKTYCIICVILSHSISYEILNSSFYVFWGGMQVPLFIQIQAFHFFKSKQYSINVKKIAFRIILPFLESQLILFFLLLFLHSSNIKDLVKMIIYDGGLGPGSYYCSVYLQIAVLCPLVRAVRKKKSVDQLFIPFVLICEIIEICLSVFNLPERIYRLLSFRYIFLIFLGIVWVEKGVRLTPKTALLSLFSLLSIYFFAYSNMDLEPFFFTTNWKTHRWPCFFYVAFFLIWILHFVYSILNHYSFIKQIYKKIASCTYEIYLFQMGLFVLMNSLMTNMQLKLSMVPVILLFCLLGGICFRTYIVLPMQKFFCQYDNSIAINK